MDLAEARDSGRLVDAGNTATGPSAAEAVSRIESGVDDVLAHGAHVLSLGGDHSVTSSIPRATSTG